MLQIERFAESIWFPWERKQDKFEDIWDGSVISTSFDNNNIQSCKYNMIYYIYTSK